MSIPRSHSRAPRTDLSRDRTDLLRDDNGAFLS